MSHGWTTYIQVDCFVKDMWGKIEMRRPRAEVDVPECIFISITQWFMIFGEFWGMGVSTVASQRGPWVHFSLLCGVLMFCVGFLQVLQYPPKSKTCSRLISSQPPWPNVLMKSWICSLRSGGPQLLRRKWVTCTEQISLYIATYMSAVYYLLLLPAYSNILNHSMR